MTSIAGTTTNYAATSTTTVVTPDVTSATSGCICSDYFNDKKGCEACSACVYSTSQKTCTKK
jgi:hypothetical protein